ncbi:MAG: choice-of-anchor Q domain-containing protein [Rubrobacteraceae bacterium]
MLEGFPTKRLLSTLFLLLLAATVLLALCAGPARAQNFGDTVRVNMDGDAGPGNCNDNCTFRDAVSVAESGATIEFIGTFDNITLTQGTVTIDKDLKIDASGIATITIQSDSTYNTNYTTYRHRPIEVESGNTVSMENLILTGGYEHKSNGGGLANAGDLTLTDVTVTGNKIGERYTGGGISNASTGNLTLDSVTVSDNQSGQADQTNGNYNGGGGGGISNSGTMTMTGSTVTGNTTGRGLDNVPECNHPPGYGGGVYNGSSGTATITDSEITNNQTGKYDGGNGGGIYVGRDSTFTIKDSTVSGNALNTSDPSPDKSCGKVGGGGIYVDEDADFQMDGVTLANNHTYTGSGALKGTGQNGAGIKLNAVDAAGVTAKITNSTITGNQTRPGYAGSVEDAGSNGAGVYITASRATLTNVTVVGNRLGGATCGDLAKSQCTDSKLGTSGGGIYIGGPNLDVTLRGSIVANNSVKQSGNYGQYPDLRGSYYLEGENLVQNTDGWQDSTGMISNVITGKYPGLTYLANNGGPTKTMAVPSDSPAHDAALPTDCPPPNTDQRGVSRPQGSRCDLGAYELESSSGSSGSLGEQAAGSGNSQRAASGATDLALLSGAAVPTVVGLLSIVALGFVGFVLYRHR